MTVKRRIPKSTQESLEGIHAELKAVSVNLFHLVLILASQHSIPEIRIDALKKMASSMGLRDVISGYISEPHQESE